ncbi:MAG: hypothetical protein JWP91_1227 [Fibrobacteres bacterium]|nr:hypothetical protein [Fibrobacterota bacterium]
MEKLGIGIGIDPVGHCTYFSGLMKRVKWLGTLEESLGDIKRIAGTTPALDPASPRRP